LPNTCKKFQKAKIAKLSTRKM